MIAISIHFQKNLTEEAQIKRCAYDNSKQKIF
jgi:hypothetical protein